MSVLITIDQAKLEALAKQLGLMPAAVDLALSRVLNRRAPQVLDQAQGKICSRVKLSREYVEGRMAMSNATVSRPYVIIKARERATRLATYMATQRILGAPGSAGDPLRGIPAGFKQGGVYTGVKPDSNKLMSKAFLIPLRAGSVAGGNGLGIFVRTGPGRKDMRQLYGPSVNQLFTGVITEMEEALAQSLEADLQAEVTRELQSIIEG
jgi:hypothetical protein